MTIKINQLCCFLLPLFLLFSPRLSFSHELTVRPLHIELKADSQKVRVIIKAHMLYWVEEILDARELPANRWPDSLKGKAKSYIDSHFFLSINDVPLHGELMDCRYIENPWDIRSGGTLAFTLTYPLLKEQFARGVSPDSVLSGQCKFYSEAWGESRRTRIFKTDLEIAGRSARAFELTPESPSFKVSWSQALITVPRTMREYFGNGFRWVFVQFSLVLFATAAVLRFPVGRSALWGPTIFSVLLFASSFLGSISMPWLQAILWVLVMGMCGTSYFRTPTWSWNLILCVTAVILGLDLAGIVVSLGPPPEYLMPARLSFLAGIVSAGFLSAAVIFTLLVLYRRRLSRIYASVWERIFFSQMRFSSQALAFVSTYFLFRDLLRHSG